MHWLEHLIPAVCGLGIAWRVGWAMAVDRNDDQYNRGWNDARRLNGVYTDNSDSSPDNGPPAV